MNLQFFFQSANNPNWDAAIDHEIKCLQRLRSSFIEKKLSRVMPFFCVRIRSCLFILASLLHHFWSSIICTIICHIFQVDSVCSTAAATSHSPLRLVQRKAKAEQTCIINSYLDSSTFSAAFNNFFFIFKLNEGIRYDGLHNGYAYLFV